jgi:hypothetical protein
MATSIAQAQKRVISERADYSDRVVVVSGFVSADGRGPIGLYYRVSFLGPNGEATDEGFGGCLGGFTDFGDAVYQARATLLKCAPQS